MSRRRGGAAGKRLNDSGDSDTSAPPPPPRVDSGEAPYVGAPPPAPEADPYGLWQRTAVVFAVTWCIYLYTAYPTVSGGDSGELIITACNLGVAHPPGYPLFTMLGRLFIDLIPFGLKAWRVHVCTLTLGALASACLYVIVCKMTKSSWVGAMSAFGFAFSPTVWLYSVQGEVFALNNGLLALVGVLTCVFYEREADERYAHYVRTQLTDATPAPATTTATTTTTGAAADCNAAAASASADGSPPRSQLLKWAYAGAFVCGLAMSNQHTSVFPVFCTVIGVFYSLVRSGQISVASCLRLGGWLTLGMSPYLYLPLSAYFKGVDSWGDQRTISGFIHHFLRREYGTFQLAADQTDDPGMIARLIVYWQVLLKESLYVTPFLAICGLVASVRSSFRLYRAGRIFVASYILYMAVFHYLANLNLNPLFLGVQARFWQQSNAHVFVWAGIGLYYIVHFAIPRVVTALSDWHAQYNILKVCVVVFVSIHIAYHFPLHSQRDNTSTHVYGTSILESMPQNAIVLVNGDINNNLVKYPQQCEGVRPDLKIMSLQLMTWPWFVPMQAAHYPGVKFPGFTYHPRVPGAYSLRQFLDANTNRKKGGSGAPVFICGPFKEGDDSHTVRYETVPYGLCAQLVKLKHKKVKKPLASDAIAAAAAAAPPPAATATPPVPALVPSPSQWREIKHWAKHLERGLDALPTLKFPAWREWKYGAETWEHVVYFDTWNRLVFLSSYYSFQANQDLSDTQLLEVSKRLFDQIFGDPIEQLALIESTRGRRTPYLLPFNNTSTNSSGDGGSVDGAWTSTYGFIELLIHYKLIRTDDYRAAGIIYGQYSKHAKTVLRDDRAFRAAERAMMRCWARFVELKTATGGGGETELSPFVRDLTNPYASGKVHWADPSAPPARPPQPAAAATAAASAKPAEPKKKKSKADSKAGKK